MVPELDAASDLPTGSVPPIAFKEWASVVRALECGKQDLIFRKGGIAEDGGEFAALHRRFFLFPTYFHQQKAGLREPEVQLFEEAMRARPAEGRIVITSWARVKRAFSIGSEAELAFYAMRHVYAPRVLIERLHARHGSTLHALEVTVHVLAEPLDLPLLDRYGGCRSWVDLDFNAR
jgi:hypothetical protein